jgi:hypothetical protein
VRPTAGSHLAFAALIGLLPLAVFARPEGHLMAVALLPLAASRRWPKAHRAALAVVLAALAVAHLATLGTRAVAPPSALGRMFVPRLVTDPVTGAPWWVAIGLFGLLLGRWARGVRPAALLAIGVPAAVYLRFASDTNPVWGQWRYFLAILPWICVAAGALAERLASRAHLRRVASLFAVACALPLAWQWRWLRAPTDGQHEFGFVQQTARAVLGDARSPALLRNMPSASWHDVPAESHLLLALGSVAGPLDESSTCEGRPRPSAVLDLEAIAARCPDRLLADDVRVFLGMFRPEPRMAELRRLGLEFEPVTTEEARTALGMPMVDTACSPVPPLGEPEPCTIRAGWYRVRRRAAP